MTSDGWLVVRDVKLEVYVLEMVTIKSQNCIQACTTCTLKDEAAFKKTLPV
jgi:hypothetical protein